MNPLHRLFSGLLVLLLAGGAAAQFNTDAMKKMQKEGHKLLEEQKAAEAAEPAGGGKAGGGKAGGGKAGAARQAYRFGANLCLDARGALSVEPCNDNVAAQQWSLDADRYLVASDGRCLAGARLVKCGQGRFQQWVHDERGRLRNDAGQCLQPRSAKAGAPVSVAVCSDAPAQVWE